MAWNKSPNEPSAMHWLGATLATFGVCEGCRFRGSHPVDACATAMWVAIPGGLVILPVCRACLRALVEARDLVLNPVEARAVAQSRARAKVRA